MTLTLIIGLGFIGVHYTALTIIIRSPQNSIIGSESVSFSRPGRSWRGGLSSEECTARTKVPWS